MPERLKKTVMGIVALVALALGGGALAQAGGSGDAEKGSPAEERSESGERENSASDTDNVQFEDESDEKGENGENGEKGEKGEEQEKGDAGEKGEGSETDESATGAGADRAKAAALGITNGGQANAVERDEENGGTWEVEVTKPNGKTVDVRLDEAFKLLAVEADGENTEDSR